MINIPKQVSKRISKIHANDHVIQRSKQITNNSLRIWRLKWGYKCKYQ